MLVAKRISLIVILLFAFTSVFAQTTKTKMKMPKTTSVYACTHCDMAAMKSGKCAMCKMNMKKMNATVMYHCDHCHTTSAMAGKCSKCKMDLTKHSMKMKG